MLSLVSVLSKMVSVIFAVLEVLFSAIITVVKLPWKFLTLINSKDNYNNNIRLEYANL